MFDVPDSLVVHVLPPKNTVKYMQCNAIFLLILGILSVDALLTKRALVTHSPYILPKYMFLNLPRDVLRSTARFRLRVHTLCFETATWNQSYFPTCDLCDADDIQDEQHVLFHCANPHMISLRRKHAPLFPPTGAHDVFTFLSQNSDKLNFFLHELRQKFPGSVEMRSKYG